MIQSQNEKLEQLNKLTIDQAPISTSSSFYKENKPCDKCEDLRKTVIKLNGYLKRSSNTNLPVN